MLSRERINARFGPKAEFKRLRAAIRANPPAYLCFCFDGCRLLWCDSSDQGTYRKHNEVTEYFDAWLDGKITRARLVMALMSREVKASPRATEKILVTRE